MSCSRTRLRNDIVSNYNAVTPVRLEPAALRSQVKHSTTEPLRSQVPRYGSGQAKKKVWTDGRYPNYIRRSRGIKISADIVHSFVIKVHYSNKSHKYIPCGGRHSSHWFLFCTCHLYNVEYCKHSAQNLPGGLGYGSAMGVMGLLGRLVQGF